MGRYVNPGNEGFRTMRNGLYVDKTGIIDYLNRTLNTSQKLTCVSRARRFGKSVTAGMLCAYYSKGCDSRSLFEGLEISTTPDYERHLNKYPVLYLDVTNFITEADDIEEVVINIQHALVCDIRKAYPTVDIHPESNLMDALYAVVEYTNEKFITIIDEWDAICREAPEHPKLMEQYMKMLRRMFKSNETDIVFAGVYMTGILPIKQYGTQSALNNFQPFSMTNPGGMARYYGFTADEVQELCSTHGRSYEEFKEWYDGYTLGSIDVFNPNSVMTAINLGVCDNYWNKTESFSSLRKLIDLDLDGMKDVLETLLNGGSATVDILSHYGEDDGTITSKNELLTLLIHYGYLNYNFDRKTVTLPNMEISTEFKSAIKAGTRKRLIEAIRNSDRLLEETINGNETYVAEAFRKLHKSHTAPLHYNNEQSLRSLVKRAYFACMDKYIRMEELHSGEGFVDIALIPRHGMDVPAMVVELKYDSTVKSAMDQIRDKDYPSQLQEFTDNLLLVGISYNPKAKEHTCSIIKMGTSRA